MKLVLKIIFLLDILLFIWAGYTQSTLPKRGALLMGIAVVIMTFVVMPLFLYIGYKNKKLSQYLFPTEPPKREKATKKD